MLIYYKMEVRIRNLLEITLKAYKLQDILYLKVFSHFSRSDFNDRFFIPTIKRYLCDVCNMYLSFFFKHWIMLFDYLKIYSIVFLKVYLFN